MKDKEPYIENSVICEIQIGEHMLSIDDLLLKFDEHLRVLHRSASTVDSYTQNTRLFFMKVGVKDVRIITADMIETYIDDLFAYRDQKNKPYSTSTIGTKIRSIKRFFEYLEQRNIIFINPAESFKEPKRIKGLKPVLTPNEVNQILEQPDLSTRAGIRDRTVLEVLYSTGIRRQELCNLRLYDIDLENKTLRVHMGKGKKDRVVPLGRHAARYLRDYILDIRSHFTRTNKANRIVFVNRFGEPINKYLVNILVRTYAQKAGITKKVTPHIFRHTFATSLINNNADIRYVQEMLGHADIRTTQEYLRVVKGDLKRVHQKTHPREKQAMELQSYIPQIERFNHE